MSAPDLLSEQAYLDRAHHQLSRMRARSEDLLASMKGADPALEWALLRRVRALAHSPRVLCFGRVDMEGGDTWYVGRRHVEDEDGDPVVIEWRAPVALPFYRAGWSDPMGLTRRRQFVVDGRQLLSIGDDHFGQQPPADASRRGAESLFLELERGRSGEMLDIVATIQPEQDEVIRSQAGGVLAVQGGPGSGKTAVGLHRAAFLLYGDDAMARANILVLGPNRTFLRYIAQVLPSLGESAVVQSTLVDLVPEVGDAPPPESPEVERLKGDGRMAEVLARAVAARRCHHDEELSAGIGVRRLTVAADVVNATVDRVASRGLPYAEGRKVFRRQLVALLAARFEDITGDVPPDGAAFERALRDDDGLRVALDRRWPSVPPATLVAELLSNAALLAVAGEGLLDTEEQRLLRRRRGRAWTASDAPLVDEVKDLVAGHQRTYGHIIVDEAQDLSPMQLRMLSRRNPSGSMTLLGDLAQAVGVWGHRAWTDVAEWLPRGDGLRVVELRYGYRSPGQVLELAGRLLPEAAPDVAPTEAVRRGRSTPRVAMVHADALLDAVAQEVATLLEQWPTVAVIAPAPLLEEALRSLRSRLDGAGGPAKVGDAVIDGLGRPVTVLAAERAKGLEFDAVVVVEPESIVAERSERAAGLRLLYVALTRPTQHLSVLSSSPLPDALSA